MPSGRESFEASKALQETLTKGRPEFEALVRQTRWGEGPVYLIGSGASQWVGLAGAYGFESLTGWPAIARSALDFTAYATTALARRAVVIAISRSGESNEILEAASAARARGAAILALTGKPDSPLAKTADGVFLVRGSGEGASQTVELLSRHAAAGYVSLTVARTLRRPTQQMEALEREFEKLPALVEWVLTQLQDAAGLLVSQLKEVREVFVVAGGFYRPVALLWALLLDRMTQKRTLVFEPGEFRPPPAAERDAAFVFLSSSRCRLKTQVHECVGGLKKSGARLLSLTDGSDRELVDGSTLAVLLPAVSEMVASTLALALLQQTAARIGNREQVRN
jgi:glucosamine--fructose-6-phosphate aminotransferase (isomerizing)